MIFAVIYIVVLVILLFVVGGIALSETTSHGQSIIIPTGCALAIFWPVAMTYLAIRWAVLRVRKLLHRAGN